MWRQRWVLSMRSLKVAGCWCWFRMDDLNVKHNIKRRPIDDDTRSESGALEVEELSCKFQFHYNNLSNVSVRSFMEKIYI